MPVTAMVQAVSPNRTGVRPAKAASAATPVRWRVLLVLLPLLPLFGQSFHYWKALPPLWALSKAFPLLSLPLALFLFRADPPPFTRQLLLSLLWFLLVPSFAATFSFQQGFFNGLTAQVKLLPLLYFFSFLALLRWLRPTTREIATGFLICAAVTFALLLLFWLLAPQSWYVTTYKVGDAPIFSADNRGNRIRMPMYFGTIGMFYCLRRFYVQRRLPWLVTALTGFGLAVAVIRMRAMVLGIAGVFTITAVRKASPRWRLALIALAPVMVLLLFTVPYLRTVFETDSTSGFNVRWTTFTEAVDFLGANPLHWLMGVGTISPLDPGGLFTWFNHFFFLADITWMGVLFEYGVVGALLLLMLPVRGLMLGNATGSTGTSPFLGSLEDYLLYVLLISPLYPFTLAPGEIAIIMATFVYTLERKRRVAPGLQYAV